jgi:hypothetical protein
MNRIEITHAVGAILIDLDEVQFLSWRSSTNKLEVSFKSGLMESLDGVTAKTYAYFRKHYLGPGEDSTSGG